MTKLIYTHNGVDITYDEDSDVWRFEARGRERTAKGLKNAKESIDKPDPKEKTFKPTKAYLLQNFNSKAKAVEVTSMAENNSMFGKYPHAWIKYESGKREKVSVSDLFEVSVHNEKLMLGMQTEEKHIDEARIRQDALRKKLVGLNIELQ